MVLSREAVKVITESNTHCPRDDAPDDMYLGNIAQDLGIIVVHSPLFHQVRDTTTPTHGHMGVGGPLTNSFLYTLVRNCNIMHCKHLYVSYSCKVSINPAKIGAILYRSVTRNFSQQQEARRIIVVKTTSV